MKVGAVKLQNYLDDNKIRPSHFSEKIAVAPSTIHRVLSGVNNPRISLASKIEAGTNGFVQIEDWVADCKHGKRYA